MDGMNIYQKLLEVRKSVTYLKKEAKGPQYNYTGSSQVLASVRAKMDELGLLLIPKVIDKNVIAETVENTDKNGLNKKTTTYFTELTMEYTWVNVDNPAETITVPWYAQGVDIAGEKGVGKALTYSEKYFILKQFNIATDKDDPDSFQQKYDHADHDKPVENFVPINREDRTESKPISSAQISLIRKLVDELVTMGISKQDSFNLMQLEVGNFNKLEELTSQKASRAINKLNDLKAQNKGA